MRFLTEEEQQILHRSLRDAVRILDNAGTEGELSFAHWTDGKLAVEARESFDGAIATQFLGFVVMPPEHWVNFSHNRDDR